jgi:hypothetical protein
MRRWIGNSQSQIALIADTLIVDSDEKSNSDISFDEMSATLIGSLLTAD